MNTFIRATLATLTLALPLVAQGQDHSHDIEEVVVTAPFDRTEADLALPATVLSDEELLQKAANSLGETLASEVGINNASYGPSVGHPVIRGQSGNRVSVLLNGIGVTDVSNQSPDHMEGVEPILAKRIEVLQGPSTLLYGSGAVGGVVNVIDGRVPEEVPERTRFVIDQSHDTNNSEDRTVVSLDMGPGNWAFHADAFTREGDNVEIDGFAIDEAAVEATEELMHHDEDEHEEEEDHDEEELPNTRGFIGNSNDEADGGSVGFAFIGERGSAGFSVSQLNTNYGLPPGSHAHGHEEEHVEGDEHDEEEHEAEEEHGEVEFVRLDLEKTRYEFRGMLTLDNTWVEELRTTVAYTDYEHGEVEYFEDGDSEVGTLYTNKGTDGRVVLTRRATGNWRGAYGLQFNSTEFSAVGEEAFIPLSDIRNIGVFGVETYEADKITAEVGLRFDRNEVDPGSCAADDTAFSASASIVYALSSNTNLVARASRSERTPSVEELFSNVETDTCANPEDQEHLVFHAATALLELGNPNLSSEVANNFDLGVRHTAGRVAAEVHIFRNQIDDYIALMLTGEEFEEQLIAAHTALDATFTGLEAEVEFELMRGDGYHIDSTLFGDMVRAEFDSGGNVPRIPPSKVGARLAAHGDDWTVGLQVSRAFDQDDAGPFELSTDGYTLVSLHADYHWDAAGGDVMLYLKGKNLLDKEVRNHASFLKNYAPEAGRSIVVGLRYQY